MQALYTVDTELSLAMQGLGRTPMENFRSAFIGETARGRYGVPYQMDVLDAAGLKGIFFIESLHTQTIGDDMLKRMVDTIASRGHDVQLHCHVEWLWFHNGRLRLPREKQHLHHLSLDMQTELIGLAKAALERAGAAPTAFRAGNYGANDDTLRACASLGLAYDSSFNATNSDSLIDMPRSETMPRRRHGVVEVPISWFYDGGGRTRHAQLCAASHAELGHALRQARRGGHPVFNIVSHSFELLDRSRQRPHGIVVRRFERLCRALAEAGGTAVFADLSEGELFANDEAVPVRSNMLRTGLRMAEQVIGNTLYERGQ